MGQTYLATYFHSKRKGMEVISVPVDCIHMYVHTTTSKNGWPKNRSQKSLKLSKDSMYNVV
jgi:hypothetical protein